jgi:hypothetical protein
MAYTVEDLKPGLRYIAPKQTLTITPHHRTVVITECDGITVWYRHYGSKHIRDTSVERFLSVINDRLHRHSVSLDPKEDAT